MKSIVMLLGVMSLLTSGYGATYYLDAASGADTNPGTSEQPWKSVDKAIVTSKPGDTVLIRPGSYGRFTFTAQSQFGSASGGYKVFKGDPATITPRPADWYTNPMTKNTAGRAVFSGLSLFKPAAATVGQYLEFSDLDLDGGGIFAKDWVNHVRFKNINIWGRWANIQGDMICGVLLRCAVGSTYHFSNILIDGCYIRDCKRGIHFGGSTYDNVVISNNHLYHMGGSALKILGGVSHAPVIIDHNHIHWQEPVIYDPDKGDRTHGTGISIRRDNLIIRNNIIHNYGNSRAIRTYHHVKSGTGYRNMLIENNLVYDPMNTYATEFVDPGPNFIVRNNTFVGRKAGRSKAHLYSTAIFMRPNSTKGYHFDGEGMEVYNNVFVGRTSIAAYPKAIVRSNICFHGAKSSAANNLVYYTGQPAGNEPALFETSGAFFVGGAGFTLQARHTKVLNNCFKLAPGSPAIGYADVSHASTTDLTGAARDARPDAGCYEFGAANP